jgi:hypothetical protein
MNTKLLLEYSIFVDLFITVGVLIAMSRRRLLREFSLLAAFLAVNCLEEGSSILLLFFRRHLGISNIRAYDIYLYSHWVFFFAESALLVLVIYSVFRKAMKPLEGLHRAGKIIFRWVGGVSVALSLGLALGPHAAGSYTMATLTSQMQQGISILILCLLLFVCFSTRYLGLTYRSHIFGVSLGLGVFATVSLIESAWTAGGTGQTLYSSVYVFSTLGSCAALLTWAGAGTQDDPAANDFALLPLEPHLGSAWGRAGFCGHRRVQAGHAGTCRADRVYGRLEARSRA